MTTMVCFAIVLFTSQFTCMMYLLFYYYRISKCIGNGGSTYALEWQYKFNKIHKIDEAFDSVLTSALYNYNSGIFSAKIDDTELHFIHEGVVKLRVNIAVPYLMFGCIVQAEENGSVKYHKPSFENYKQLIEVVNTVKKDERIAAFMATSNKE